MRCFVDPRIRDPASGFAMKKSRDRIRIRYLSGMNILDLIFENSV
jgi:hypothetical protein